MQIAKVQAFRTQAGWLLQAKEYASTHSLALFVREVGRLKLEDLGELYPDQDPASMVPGALVEGVVSETNRYISDEHDIRLTIWGGGEMFELVATPESEVCASFGTFDEGGQDLPMVIDCTYCARSLLPAVPGLNVHSQCGRQF